MSESDNLSGKSILITGASGLLGRGLTARLDGVGEVTGVGYSKAAARILPVDLRDCEWPKRIC